MRPFRTIGQRRHRRRKAQVSAVATVFGLLLIVEGFAEFALAPLPSLERSSEFNHQLTVENQLAQVKATVLALSEHPGYPLSLLTPISLGSAAVPPFGPPASSDLVFTPAGGSSTWSTIFTGAYSPPVFGTGAWCTPVKVGSTYTCTASSATGVCAPPYFQNYSVNASTFNYNDGSAGNNCINVNFRGNNDTITFAIGGTGDPKINLVILGNDDHITLTYAGGTGHLNLTVYGARNTFTLTEAGSTNFVNVNFIGQSPGISTCAYKNVSSTITYSLGVSGSNDRVNVTYYNGVGYQAGPTTSSLGGSNTKTVTSTPTPVACAFYKGGSVFPVTSTGALTVNLNNGYLSPALVTLDSGAEIFSAVGGRPTMVYPPPFNFAVGPAGSNANLTLISFAGTAGQDTGYLTGGVVLQVLTVSMVSELVGGSVGQPTLTVTTAYPAPWSTYFSSNAAGFLSGGPVCTSSQAIAAPFTCLSPPPGVSVQVSVTLHVASYTITAVVVTTSVV